MESKDSIRDITGVIQLALGVIGIVGLIIFGWPAPDTRPKIYELYLAGVWALITMSASSVYWNWKDSKWSQKIMAVAAPLAALLYLQKYFMT